MAKWMRGERASKSLVRPPMMAVTITAAMKPRRKPWLIDTQAEV